MNVVTGITGKEQYPRQNQTGRVYPRVRAEKYCKHFAIAADHIVWVLGWVVVCILKKLHGSVYTSIQCVGGIMSF